MTAPRRRHRWRIAAAAFAASACAVPALTGSATGDSVTQLKDKLGSTQSQLNSNTQREQSLSSRVSALDGRVSAMSSQIAIVQSREAAAHDQLLSYDAKLAAARVAVAHELHHIRHVRHVLAHARRALAAELESQYEQPQPSLVSVLVSAKGFQQLLDTVQYLSMAKHQEQRIITAARVARRHAEHAESRLFVLQRSDASAADDAQRQTNALAGMNSLLSSQQSALSDERAAQAAALAASQEKGSQLKAALATIQKQEQAAEQAAEAINTSSDVSTGSGGGGGLGATAGWAIPYKIVLCESGGQNLPPNGAGASGYYQIVPATWREFGGSGPAAYLSSKSEQDTVAARIWNGGAGASNWACSAITGVT
jgi:septal ring factor EnvC (AmiA/AmiB activator)